MSGLTKAAIVAVLIVGTNTLGGCVAAPILLANEVMVRMDNHLAGVKSEIRLGASEQK